MLIVVSLALSIPIILFLRIFKVTFKALKHNVKADYEAFEWGKKRFQAILKLPNFWCLYPWHLGNKFQNLVDLSKYFKSLGKQHEGKAFEKFKEFFNKSIIHQNVDVSTLGSEGTNFNFLGIYEYHFKSLGKHCEGQL